MSSNDWITENLVLNANEFPFLLNIEIKGLILY